MRAFPRPVDMILPDPSSVFFVKFHKYPLPLIRLGKCKAFAIPPDSNMRQPAGPADMVRYFLLAVLDNLEVLHIVFAVEGTRDRPIVRNSHSLPVCIIMRWQGGLIRVGLEEFPLRI
jgi:hypothetical protein